MTVTQHARWTAIFQLFTHNGMNSIHATILLTQLFHEWNLRCGLRETDLTLTLEELLRSGSLRRQKAGELPAIELTDRGLLQMQRFLDSSGLFDFGHPIEGLTQQLNTRRVLARARQRTVGRAAGATVTRPASDRRSMRSAA